MSEPVIGRRVLRFDTITSTTDEAARLGAAGEPEGTIVIAAAQTAGRGRAGRAWLAPPHTALLCSVLLRPFVPPVRLPVLSLVAGLAAAEAIERTAGVHCRLKWPNDVWLGDAGRKVAGILLTSRAATGGIAYAVAGIGINLTTQPEDLPPGGTSILIECGAAPDQASLFNHVVDRLNHAYDDFRATNGRPNLDPWRQRAALLGERVTIEDGGTRLVGTFAGIDDDGALLLHDDSGSARRVIAGELTRGPRSLGRV